MKLFVYIYIYLWSTSLARISKSTVHRDCLHSKNNEDNTLRDNRNMFRNKQRAAWEWRLKYHEISRRLFVTLYAMPLKTTGEYGWIYVYVRVCVSVCTCVYAGVVEYVGSLIPLNSFVWLLAITRYHITWYWSSAIILCYIRVLCWRQNMYIQLYVCYDIRYIQRYNFVWCIGQQKNYKHLL